MRLKIIAYFVFLLVMIIVKPIPGDIYELISLINIENIFILLRSVFVDILLVFLFKTFYT